MKESKSTFVRQSLWMIAATLAGGLGMMLVHSFVSKLAGPGVYAEFKSLLSIFYIVGAPQAALWNLFAQRSAQAVTAERMSEVRAAGFKFAGALLGLMVVVALPLAIAAPSLTATLKLPSPAALWATWGLILATLLLSIPRGLLQGGQSFVGLGLTGIVDGFGRLAAVVALLLVVRSSTAAIAGALLGNVAAIGVGLWLTRPWAGGQGAGVNWRSWLAGLGPLTLAAASATAFSQIDILFLQASVPADWIDQLGQRYSTGAQVGFALTQFTAPLALVLFPKIARSAASGMATDALKLKFVGTLALGGCAALAATILPWLPVKILFPAVPTNLSAPLVPWFVWAMLCFTLANVLLADRLAKNDFQVVPWTAGLAVAYAATLWGFKAPLLAGTPAEALPRVAMLLFAFNAALLLLAAAFHRWRPAIPRAHAAAPPAAAR
jgi:hypothetical protein